MSAYRYHVVGWALLLAAAGCGKTELYTNVQERDANEMIAILQKKGVDCDKSSGEEGMWNLTVSPRDFGKAVEELKARGYPKDHHATMDDLFQRSGLVSSPTEERVRYIYGLSQELSSTISRIDGVLSARVHIVLPENDPFKKDVKPSSAAIFIEHRHDANLEASLPEVKNLVTSSIEGLTYENVNLTTFPAADPTQNQVGEPPQEWVEILDIRVAPESASRFYALFGGVSVIAIVNLLLVVGVWHRSRRPEPEAS